jgi:hypothetical protein
MFTNCEFVINKIESCICILNNEECIKFDDKDYCCPKGVEFFTKLQEIFVQPIEDIPKNIIPNKIPYFIASSFITNNDNAMKNKFLETRFFTRTHYLPVCAKINITNP